MKLRYRGWRAEVVACGTSLGTAKPRVSPRSGARAPALGLSTFRVRSITHLIQTLGVKVTALMDGSKAEREVAGGRRRKWRVAEAASA